MSCKENKNTIWENITSSNQIEIGEERWIRHIDPRCWISVFHRMTGFGYMEWETAIVFLIEDESDQRRWKSDNRNCLIISGDRRDELETMPKENLCSWYNGNINGNRNSMETFIEMAKNASKE